VNSFPASEAGAENSGAVSATLSAAGEGKLIMLDSNKQSNTFFIAITS
jgi:hypothetical protein